MQINSAYNGGFFVKIIVAAIIAAIYIINLRKEKHVPESLSDIEPLPVVKRHHVIESPKQTEPAAPAATSTEPSANRKPTAKTIITYYNINK